MNRETFRNQSSTTRHGEFKTPGGKLVVVEFAVRDSRMRGVQITGDFFLYPEDALDRLNAALEGASDNETRSNRIAALNAALSSGDVLIGLNPEAVATAVERALAGP